MIAPGETHGFVVRVAAQQLAKLGSAAPRGRFSTLLTLAYAVAGRSLVVPHTLSWSCPTPRAQNGFLLSFKAAAVAPGSATLSARLVVHNGFDDTRELSLLVGPLKPSCPASTAASGGGDSANAMPPIGATSSLLQLSSMNREDVAKWAVQCGQVPGLQAAVQLGHIEGHASTSVSVGFLPLRRGRVEINSIFLHDRTNDIFYRMSEPFEVLAGGDKAQPASMPRSSPRAAAMPEREAAPSPARAGDGQEQEEQEEQEEQAVAVEC